MDITHEVSELLKHYVYLYNDPFTDEPFYIGKGNGNRALSHLSAAEESDKVAKIQEIRDRGREPRIEILRYGLTEKEAALIEASLIDFVGTTQLTNKVRGLHSRTYGRITLKELIATSTAEQVEIDHRVMLITINKRYRSNMNPLELLEATRGIWKVGPRRERSAYAFAVYRGTVREVYQINQWHPAGTLKYKTRDSRDFLGSGRWEFDGQVAQHIREIYVGKSVRSYQGKSNQNPIRYVNT